MGQQIASSSQIIRTNVYVDGFNLYYGAAKHTRFKWLDIAALCRAVLPGIQINRIRYFTALVTASADDPHNRQRQETYIRALQTLPRLTVHYGHYLASTLSARLVAPLPNGQRYVDVLKREEKGSDVNIATYMLVDAFRGDCEQLVVITNDSDLAEPIRIINKELKIPVGVFNPHTEDTARRKAARTGAPVRANPSVTLRKVSRFTRPISSAGPTCHMALSQFPRTLVDGDGRTISRPVAWD